MGYQSYCLALAKTGPPAAAQYRKHVKLQPPPPPPPTACGRCCLLVALQSFWRCLRSCRVLRLSGSRSGLRALVSAWRLANWPYSFHNCSVERLPVAVLHGAQPCILQKNGNRKQRKTTKKNQKIEKSLGFYASILSMLRLFPLYETLGLYLRV